MNDPSNSTTSPSTRPSLLRRPQRHLRIGVAFGSGGARGWAHIGAIQAFQDLGFQPDIVTGTSVGSIAAAALASNSLEAFLNFSKNIDWLKATQLFVELGKPNGGLIEGRKVIELLQSLLPVQSIKDLSLPYAALATNLTSGKATVFSQGNLLTAIRASIAIPGFFSPLAYQDELYVDGGLTNPLPVDTARAMGADRVIAININNEYTVPLPDSPSPLNTFAESFQQTLNQFSHHWNRFITPPFTSSNTRTSTSVESNKLAETKELNESRESSESNEAIESKDLKEAKEMRDSKMNLFDVFLRALRIAEDRLTLDCIRTAPPDLLIEPPIGNIATLDFRRASIAIQAGYQATYDALISHRDVWCQPHAK